MNCKICQNPSRKLFSKIILRKYSIDYFCCSSCGFIQTEKPYWLNESYVDAINDGDIGYISRNLNSAYITATIINFCFDSKSNFIDYGGGYGLFTRLMRDKGFEYYREDKYCLNIFAKNFEHDSLTNSKFELLTAFEVFEHLEYPIDEMKRMLEFSDSIFFSTKIYPIKNDELLDWWYLGLYHGQHISLYSIKSIQKIAEIFDLNYYSDGKDFHLLTKKKINGLLFRFLVKYKVSFFLYLLLQRGRKSLIEKDSEKYLDKNQII